MEKTNIADDEQLARCLYDPSFFHEGQLAARAFELSNFTDRNGIVHHEPSLSVLRESMCDVLESSKELPYREGESIIGYASLQAGVIRSIASPLKDHIINVDVKHAPSQRLPAHAGIFTKIDGMNIKGKPENGHTSPLVSYVQSQLVSHSQVKLFDKGIKNGE